jgi:hypothetical protein
LRANVENEDELLEKIREENSKIDGHLQDMARDSAEIDVLINKIIDDVPPDLDPQ